MHHAHRQLSCDRRWDGSSFDQSLKTSSLIKVISVKFEIGKEKLMLLYLTLRFSSPAAGGAEVSDGGGAPPGQHVEPGGAGELPVAAVHAAPSAEPLLGPPERKLYH